MGIDLKNIKPDIRYLNDMKEVVYDKEWLKTAPNLELYYMYRRVRQENDLNNNITIIPARMLGKEFTKTKGHIHIGNYGETYTVLEGETIFLMQKMAKPSAAIPAKGLRTNDKVVKDVYAVKAKKGESVIIPSYYGHVTINSSSIDLKTGDWSSKNCKSDYSLFERLNGACYFAIAQKSKIKNQKSKIKWVKNKNYKNVPPLRFEEPLKSLPKDLSFLKG